MTVGDLTVLRSGATAKRNVDDETSERATFLSLVRLRAKAKFAISGWMHATVS